MSAGAHAIVIGGSITGLATAKALSSRFEKVTVIERDPLPDAADFRAGVPQGRQLHLLLRRGQDLLEELYPGFSDELRQNGAPELRWGRDLRWYHFGGWKQPNNAPLSSIFATRLLIESILRKRLRAHRQPGAARRHQGGDAARRATGGARGVKLDGGRELEADLVVDASGRESRSVAWLESLGFPRPEERIVNANLGYATRMYRRPAGLDVPWKALVVHATPPTHNRIGAILPVEGDRWQVVLCGANGDYPPTSDAEFLEFARQPARRRGAPGAGEGRAALAHLRLPAHLQSALPLRADAAAPRAVRGARRRRVRLQSRLRAGHDHRPHQRAPARRVPRSPSRAKLAGPFQKRLSRALGVPWFLATTEDFRYPETEGREMTTVIASCRRPSTRSSAAASSTRTPFRRSSR